jgi:alpha-1,2-mannosyltransferase
VLARRTQLAILAVGLAGSVLGAIHGGFTDLFVYRYAGHAVLSGTDVYASDDPVTGLPFTYPPFAAVAMAALAVLPSWLAPALWTGASTAALAGAVVVVRRSVGRPTPWWVLAALCAGAVALEPVWQNLAFGQVNLIVMLAVLVDLLVPDRRVAGVLLGVAAGVKLTPLVFVVLLVLVGRRAVAARALAVFAGTVAVGFVAMPGPAVTYWTDGLVDARRVGPPSLAHNQSVYGVLTRLLDEPPPVVLWLAAAGPLALAILLVAAVQWCAGDHLLGSALAALAMLLASPVSWSHHWVWSVPVALALWERSKPVATAWTMVFVARPILWPPWGEHREYAWGALDQVAGNAYVLAAVALAAWAAVHLVRHRGAAPPVGPAQGSGRSSCDEVWVDSSADSSGWAVRSSESRRISSA